MNFSQALHEIKEGKRLKRIGWNHPSQYIFYVEPGKLTFEALNLESKEIRLAPFLAIKTVQGTFVSWLASQTDLLAEDWEEVN